MSANSVFVSSQVFMMATSEIISFDLDFTKLIPSGVVPNGESTRLIRVDTGVDVSDDYLLGSPQRTGNIVTQTVGGLQANTSYVLVVSIELDNGNVRSSTLVIEVIGV